MRRWCSRTSPERSLLALPMRARAPAAEVSTLQVTNDRRSAEEQRSSADPLSPRERASLRGGRGARAALLLVVVSLVLAIVLPVVAQRRIDQLRDEISEITDPARARVAEIRLAVALEAAARRGYLLTRDRQLASDIEVSRERRREALQELERLAPRLEPPAPAQVELLAARLAAFDAQFDSAVAHGLEPPASPAVVAPWRRTFGEALDAAARLRTTIVGTQSGYRRQLRTIDATVSVLTGVLVVLGLVAASLVARLGARYGRVARRLDESELRYREIAAAAERRRVELERVTESRTRLIRGFTHDVKNPLGTADGFLALLEDGASGTLEERQQAWVTKSRRSIRQALELIQHLLELARAEAGQLELRMQETDLAALVHDVCDEFGASVQSKGLAMEVSVPESLPRIETDPARVRQVFGNLLSNAVKYTPAGGRITVRADVRASGANGARRVALVVSDTGTGIPADRLPMIFLEFTRFQPSTAEGAGIGLAIGQKIAHALHGEITVESEVGRGSTFTLHLPFAATAAPSPRHGRRRRRRGAALIAPTRASRSLRARQPPRLARA
jgi:signal transduction histidine kinase